MIMGHDSNTQHGGTMLTASADVLLGLYCVLMRRQASIQIDKTYDHEAIHYSLCFPYSCLMILPT